MLSQDLEFAKNAARYIDYDPYTGLFTWLARYKSSHIQPGTEAGHLTSKGYVRLLFAGRAMMAHRLAWIYMAGETPPESIDHINGIRSDNSWGNLRLATAFQNGHNRAPNRGTVSGAKGVHRHNGRWGASIQAHNKRTFLGVFQTIQEAAAAYAKAAEALHGEYKRIV